MDHLRNIAAVFEKTGTLWENYSPELIAPGTPAKGDFVGWTGIGPILYFIEFAIGVKADAIKNQIVWNVTTSKRVGIEKFWFGGKTVDLVCEAADKDDRRTLRVSSDKPFALIVLWKGKRTKMDITANKVISWQL